MDTLTGITVVIFVLFVLSIRPHSDGGMRYCRYCDRYVKPDKGFSVGGFILGFGLLYMVYWCLKSTHCPICHADSSSLQRRKPEPKAAPEPLTIPKLHD